MFNDPLDLQKYIKESLNKSKKELLESSLKVGYYFGDSAEDSVYTEGGHYDSFDKIKKKNTSDF